MRISKIVYIGLLPFSLFHLYAEETCKCGVAKYDYDYKQAINELKEAIRKVCYTDSNYNSP